MRRPRVAVIGAGAFGGWSALALQRMGAEVELIDAWGAGNPRASSGGESRVIRAIYGTDRVYVEMVLRAFELWAELERTESTSLYTETGSLWMFRDDDSYLERSIPLLEEAGLPVERPSVAGLVKRYPQIDFEGVKSAGFEPRSGVLAARRSCRAVVDRFVKEGGRVRLAYAAPGALEGGTLHRLDLSDGSTLEADHYVFACGPWLGHLFPEAIGDRVLPSRQEVHYFGTPSGSGAYGAGELPVWIDFGDRVVYGLPDTAGRGMKVADDTRGERFDPTSGDRTATRSEVERLRRFLALRFPHLAEAPCLESRVCQYENSPDGDLIIDRHPEAGNVLLVGGGSGHGFKLGPAVGEMVARQILGSEPLRPKFQLGRFEGQRSPETQFERAGGSDGP